MSKRVYISADYSIDDGDRNVVDELHKWAKDNKHKTEFVDTASVVSGSVSKDKDCRPCDLKNEFNEQIKASSAVIFIIGDKTASRTAGSSCKRSTDGMGCACTPYKQNSKGTLTCKIYGSSYSSLFSGDVNMINTYSYIEHEFRQAVKKDKKIIIVYNSLEHHPGWLPSYMKDYENEAHPFWIYNSKGDKIGDYYYIKRALGYE